MTYRISILIAVLFSAPIAHSFCGFYVAKADAKLFNKASQVVIVRHDDKTVMTMANDFKGDPKEFAVVIPVPTFIKEGQIHIADKKIIDHLDAYTAPRLRPISVAYQSSKFMLPIRLGTVNAQGAQELFIYAKSEKAARTGGTKTGIVDGVGY